MGGQGREASAASREWQEREQSTLSWLYEDAKNDSRGVGATVLLMLRERTTSEGRMATILEAAAHEFDSLATLASEGGCALSQERYRAMAARCRSEFSEGRA